MSTGTRKGFKFVSKGGKVESESINFDDVEKEATTTPHKRQAEVEIKTNKAKLAAGGALERYLFHFIREENLNVLMTLYYMKCFKKTQVFHCGQRNRGK
jgi:hypothetical protein